MLGTIASKKHFRKRLVKNGTVKPVEWSRGLKLLLELRRRGVNVSDATVVKTMEMVFVVLFGRGQSRVRRNRMMQAANDKDYGHYAREVNKIWGKKLFPETEMFHESTRLRMPSQVYIGWSGRSVRSDKTEESS